MPITTFVAIRHGSTRYNREGLLQGHRDVPLDASGQRQAQALRAYLSAYTPHRVYSSDLGRAEETARLAVPQSPIQLLNALRERDYGSWTGQRPPVGDGSGTQRDPHFQPGGGESDLQLRRRAVAVAQELAHRHPGETVLLFSHGGLLRSLLSWALGFPSHQVGSFVLGNASVSVFCLEAQGKCWVHSLNVSTTRRAPDEAGVDG